MADSDSDQLSGLLSDFYTYPAYDPNSAAGDLGATLGKRLGATLASPLVLRFVPPGPWDEAAARAARIAGGYVGGKVGREALSSIDWAIAGVRIAFEELSDWRAWHELISRASGAGLGPGV